MRSRHRRDPPDRRRAALTLLAAFALLPLLAPGVAAEARYWPPAARDALDEVGLDGLPSHAVRVRIAPSPIALVPGGSVSVELINAAGLKAVLDRADVTVALFFAYDLARWDPEAATPQQNLDSAAWTVRLRGANLSQSDGVASFTYPGLPGAARTPSVLWATYSGGGEDAPGASAYYNLGALAATKGGRGALYAAGGSTPTVVFAN